MKKFIILFSLLFVCIASFAQWAQPIPTANTAFKYSTLTDAGAGDTTVYYLYNKDAKAFLNQGGKWTTQATLKETGIKVMVSKYISEDETEWDGKTVLITDYPETMGKWMLLCIDTEIHAYVDRGSQANYFWEIEEMGSSTFRIHGAELNPFYNPDNYGGCYFGKPTTPAEAKYPDAICPEIDIAEDATAMVDWQFITEENYATYLEKLIVYNKAAELKAAIDEAKTDYSDKVSTSNAETVYDNTSSTLEELTAALDVLNKSIAEARKEMRQEEVNDASEDNPKDVTSWVVNPSFDGDATGWTSTYVGGTNTTNVGYQSTSYTNGDITISGFIESWANSAYSKAISGRAIGIGELSQTLHSMPQGKYKLAFDYIATNQDGITPVNGVQGFAKSGTNDLSLSLATGIGSPEHFELLCVNDVDSLIIGIRTTDACNANWIAIDNFALTYYGPTTDDSEKVLMNQIVEKALTVYPLESLDETLANKTVKDAYKAAIEAAQAATEDYTAKGEAVNAAKTNLTSSITAYAAYKAEVDHIINYISNWPYTEKSEDEKLLSDYVNEDNVIEPDTEFPLGSAAYIYKNLLPTDDEITTETQRITDFLSTAIATSIKEGEDCTSMIADANFADANGKGWTKSSNTTNIIWTGGLIPSEDGSIGCPVAESYHSYFDIYQTLSDLPEGIFSLSVNGFCRLDGSGETEVPAEIYMNGFSTPLMNLQDDAIATADAVDGTNCYLTSISSAGTDCPVWQNPIFVGCKRQSPYDSADSQSADGTGYVPNGMEGASVAFSAGRYKATVYGLATDGKITLGIRNNISKIIWAEWGNFKLTYFGKTDEALQTAIDTYKQKLSNYIEANSDNMTTPSIDGANSAITTARDASDTDAKYEAVIGLNKQIIASKENVEAVSAFISELDAIKALFEAYPAADRSSYEAISDSISSYKSLTTDEIITLTEEMVSAEAAIKFSAIEKAIASATTDNPVDITSMAIINPDFETGNTDGWTYRFSTTTISGYNSSSYKGSASISKYFEGWRSGSNPLGDGSINQVVNLPAGYYSLGVDAIASLQSITDNSWQTDVKGVYLYVKLNGRINYNTEIRTANGSPQHFSLNFPVKTASKVEIGIMTEDATANWVAVDNFTLTCNEFLVDSIKMEDSDISTLDNAIYIEKSSSKIGSQLTLPVLMKNNFDVTGFQFDLYLPDGVSVAKDTDEFDMIELSTERTTTKKTDLFNSAHSADGSIRIICSSTNNYTFSGSDGEVATITIEISDSIEPGDHPIFLRNIEMSNVNGDPTRIDYIKTTLNFTAYDQGDANGDGYVSISDFSAIASYILFNTPKKFVEKAADVNEDGVISVSDLSSLVTKILSASNTSAKSRVAASQKNYSAEMNLGSADSYPGDEVTLQMDITNSMAFDGYQFDLNVPAGFTVKDATLSTSRTSTKATNCFNFTDLGNGNVRVLCASTYNAQFKGNEGTVANITLAIDRSVTAGKYEVGIENPEVSASGKAVKAATKIATLNIAEPTGISSYEQNCNNIVYDINGRKVSSVKSYSGSIESLPKGVYIVNGKKIVK